MNSLEKKIIDFSLESLINLGYNIVTLRTVDEKKTKLYFTVEKLDNTPVSLFDCRIISKHLNALIEVEKILESFAIEVSSAGVERPLIKLIDYTNHINKEAKVHLILPINEKKIYSGVIEKILDNNITLKINQNEMSHITLDFNNIKKANLIFSDELFRQLIKQVKKD